MVRIPSYDDLTPSIPDVLPGEALASVERLLGSLRPVGAAGSPDSRVGFSASATPDRLFACLRSSAAPDAVIGIARDFSPRIERHGRGCVVFDVAGLGRLLGDPPSIGAELQRAAAAHAGAIHVAIAPTQVAALLLTLAHSSLTVVTTDVAAALTDVHLECLRRLTLATDDEPTLIGASAQHRLATAKGRRLHAESIETIFDVLPRWGLTTIGELAALPAGDLSARLGQEGLVLQQLARGIDLRPLVPDPDVPRFVERMEFEWPIDALEPLSFVLARLLDPLSSALERADRAAAAVRLDLRLVDRTTFSRMLQLPAAMRDPRALRTLLLLDLESHPPSAAIDVVTIEIDPAPGRVIQYSLLERALPSAETLATLTARLAALVGESRCGSPRLLDTHRPDAFKMCRFDPDSHGVRTRAPDEIVPPRAGPVEPDRVVPCLRRFRMPVAVRVTVEGGRPVAVAIDRRGMPGGAVTQSSGPWRSSGAWWDPAATHWNRDEWDVAFSDGVLCRLFRDRTTGTWFMEGILD